MHAQHSYATRTEIWKFYLTVACQVTARTEVVTTLQQANAQQHKVSALPTNTLVLFTIYKLTRHPH